VRIFRETVFSPLGAVADPGFAKGGRTMASARSASVHGGLGAEPPAGSRGRAPGGGSGGQSPPEVESFLYIFTQKKWPKVEDLRENLPPCLRRAAMASPKFWPMGGDRPDRP